MSVSPQRRRRRRADADRNVAAILDAALKLLGDRPDASMDDIAQAAGITRQTIYAHYPSREALVAAVRERAMADTVAALDAADLKRGSPAEALDRLVGAGWHTLGRYPNLASLRREMSLQEQHDLHRPILDRLQPLIRRGQREGIFDSRLPAGWLLAAFLGLAHTAAEEVAAGRMSTEEAGRALRESAWALLGVTD
jgi:AcrR family transcriptional regulator